MRNQYTPFPVLAAILLAGASLAFGQGRPIDWPSFGGDAQRSGWEKSDSRITKENVKDFVLVLKRKLGNGDKLTPPVVIGTLISYRGFKELAFVAGSSGTIWAIDADMDRIFWQKQLDKGVPACPGYVPAFPALTPPLNFAAGRPRPATPPPATPPPASARPVSPRVGGTGFGNVRSVFALSADGKLHQLNSADGSDQFPPLDFIPAGAQASSLTVQDGVIYTTTRTGCGGAPSGVWALNLNDANPKPASFTSKESIEGFALGSDGTVFVTTSKALRSLKAKDLTLTHEFTIPDGGGAVAPVVFPWKEKPMVVAASLSTLSLIDAETLQPLFRTPPQADGGNSVFGSGISTWEDAEGTRWILAPLTQGPKGGQGVIVAFRVEERDGKPILTQTWMSQKMNMPIKPVITNGIVFTLSTTTGHATLYALDGLTGKEMYSTGNQMTAPGSPTGLTVVNGRVYVTTADGTLYAFGVFMER